jgi:hypothetical protein
MTTYWMQTNLPKHVHWKRLRCSKLVTLTLDMNSMVILLRLQCIREQKKNGERKRRSLSIIKFIKKKKQDITFSEISWKICHLLKVNNIYVVLFMLFGIYLFSIITMNLWLQVKPVRSGFFASCLLMWLINQSLLF